MIDATTLRKIAPSLSDARATELARLITKKCGEYGITNTEVFRKFLANLVQESGEFSHKVENMNYTSAARIAAVWPSRFTATSAAPFVRQPRALANRVYNGRMGNQIGTDDGYEFRGGGYIGITGREAYQRYADYKNMNIQVARKYVQTTEEGALDCAFWFFCVWKKLANKAATASFREIVIGINGGTIGIADRERYYAACLKHIK
jgi:putative chitinase